MAASVWAPAAGVDGAVRRPERRTGARAGLGFGAKGEGAGERGRGGRWTSRASWGSSLSTQGKGGPGSGMARRGQQGCMAPVSHDATVAMGFSEDPLETFE